MEHELKEVVTQTDTEEKPAETSSPANTPHQGLDHSHSPHQGPEAAHHDAEQNDGDAMRYINQGFGHVMQVMDFITQPRFNFPKEKAREEKKPGFRQHFKDFKDRNMFHRKEGGKSKSEPSEIPREKGEKGEKSEIRGEKGEEGEKSEKSGFVQDSKKKVTDATSRFKSMLPALNLSQLHMPGIFIPLARFPSI
jgi:hypothetical protein